jgi:hypothetical protein
LQDGIRGGTVRERIDQVESDETLRSDPENLPT